jgi:ABC-2 type transport system permease protein
VPRAMGLVAARELTEGIRSRAFRVSVAITVVLVAASALLPRFLGADGPSSYVVVLTDDAPPSLGRALTDAGAAVDTIVRVRTVSDRAAAIDAVRAGRADLALAGGTALVDGTAPPALESVVARARAASEQTRRVESAGLSAAQIAELTAPLAPLEVTSVTDGDRDGGEFAVASITVVLLFIALSVYGGAVLNGVLTEKSSRIIEVLLSSVRPTDVLGGKIAGIGGLGLIQVLVMAVVAAVTSRIAGTADLPSSTAPTVALSVLWFVLGFGLYSSFYAMAGSLVSRQEDAQAAATPVTLLMTVGYVATFAVVLPDPDGVAARVLGLLPLTAPMAVIARTALGEVRWWEQVLAVALTVGSIVAVVRLAGRVYAGAALSFGGRVRLRQALAADRG